MLISSLLPLNVQWYFPFSLGPLLQCDFAFATAYRQICMARHEADCVN